MAHDDTRSNLDPRKDDGNVAGNLIGEGVGGASGIAAGAAIGSLGGPVGTVIGALAGAIGGWWAGRAVSEAASDYTDHDDAHYRDQHIRLTPSPATTGASTAGRTLSYDDARPAYQLGHLAGRNPDYANRTFDEVEGDLRRGWTSDIAAKHGDWTSVRSHARAAYERGRTGTGSASRGAMATGGGLMDAAADKMDDLKDRIDGNPASRPGRDATDNPRR